MFTYLRLIALLLMALPLQAATILVFGDSLSAGYGLAPGQGWVALLENSLAPRHRVINASVSGETTAGGLSRLPATLKRHRPDVVVLELGGNDGLRGLPMDEMRRNLEQMIRLAQQHKARVMLVGIILPPNYGQKYSTEFRSVYDTLARQYGLNYVPRLMADFEADPSKFQPDGIHPRAEVQLRMMETVRSRLPLS
ncbi:MAG: arylesterase [Pseudogulbenkiania sp.]|nr:arylesterase [Pseudogulbenkiania sp.]